MPTGSFDKGIKPNFCCFDFKINYVYGTVAPLNKTIIFLLNAQTMEGSGKCLEKGSLLVVLPVLCD